ncbi:hypothetical protein [Planomicrobium sp. CPCC 101079]|uniref:hypothetical protein n=1 Tax=Planomicrobium sp. CPCC 101079 TaxID=2599618 RepID=UPI001C9789A0|nr:hypothetical protein [Planomicrobium sp. CPCC 101079]
MTKTITMTTMMTTTMTEFKKQKRSRPAPFLFHCRQTIAACILAFDTDTACLQIHPDVLFRRG